MKSPAKSMLPKFYTAGFFLLSLSFFYCGKNQEPVQTGLDRIAEYRQLFAGKRIGLVTNHTAVNRSGEHLSDVFFKLKDCQVTALFGPEHGIRGNQSAGDQISDETDPTKQIPVYSLYGQTNPGGIDSYKPTPEMLSNVDVLVFDIQDIGARFYTYESTLALCMEAAAEQGKKFVVLDRPNPINGVAVEGNILEAEFATFVGLFPIPVRHGLTMGELAQLINGEGWLTNDIKADLTVIPLSAWQRHMWFDQTGLEWLPPSPNIPDLSVAAVYPGTCLFEGTNISEGRGTYQPFLRIGAPWFTVDSFENINNLVETPGLLLGPVAFVPKSIPAMAPQPKYMEKEITGLSLSVTDRNTFLPFRAGITLVKYFHDANPDSFQWREAHFDRLCGTDKIRKFIIDGRPVEEIFQWLQPQEKAFEQLRKKYLLY